MRFNPSPMLLVATLVVAAAVGAVTPAGAAPISDVAYMNLSRCAGLEKAMGRDVAPIEARLNTEELGRPAFVLDRADQMRGDAGREVRRAGEDARRHLNAEVDGPCAALAKPAPVATR